MTDTNHHWENKNDRPVEELLGFVYCITNKKTGRIYLGRKQYWNKRGKHWYESDWRYYCGSSTWLLEDIDTDGICNFEFRILAEFERKSGISVGEATAIVCSGSLLETERFYNRAAPSIRGKIALTDSDRQEIVKLKDWINGQN